MAGPAAAAVAVRGLTKAYGDVEAVRGIDLEVRAGEVFGFLGPNGAGKSTTIKILCTLVRPSGGAAEVAGFDVARAPREVRRRIGLVFQEPTLDGYLSAEQNLRFHADLYGVPRAEAGPRVSEVLELVGLDGRRDDLVLRFSGGMRRRLEIGRGLLHAPQVLFLDEPTIGLDPQTRASIWEYLTRLREREDITVFVTTHYMDEAEHCDRIAIMDQGRIVALGTPGELKAGVGNDRVLVTTSDDEAAARLLRDPALFGAGLDPGRHEGRLAVGVPDGAGFVPHLVTTLAAHGVRVRSVSVQRPSLDDVFLAYTGRTIRDAEGAARPPATIMGGHRR